MTRTGLVAAREPDRGFHPVSGKRRMRPMAGRAPAGSNRLSAQELAAATPATRNRYADLLRVVSIFVVVLGHWMMAVLAYHDGKFTGQNLLEIDPWTHILTWIFQVMPIFFIVGGFTNASSGRSAREG